MENDKKVTTIQWATVKRSYFSSLDQIDSSIVFTGGSSYLTEGKSQRLRSKIMSSLIFDLFGFFRIPKISGYSCNFYISFNKFLRCDKPYILLLEMPEAPGHYSPYRFKSSLGRKRLKKCLEDPNLKAVIPISDAALKAITPVWGSFPEKAVLQRIYIFTPDNPYISREKISKSSSEPLRCLFVTTGFRFRTKGGLEVLDAFSKIKNAKLTIITKIDSLRKSDLESINANPNIELFDFVFSKDEMQKQYASHQILIHLTSDDSSPLTIMEAMKGGECVITTKFYAIPEMVLDGKNGFLTDPKFQPFKSDFSLNYLGWRRQSKVLNKNKVCGRISSFLQERIAFLDSHRDVLEKMRASSYQESVYGKFSREANFEEWLSVLKKIS